MANTLIAYFSRSGTTAQIAEQLSRKLGADLDCIEPQLSYAHTGGYFRGILHSLLHRTPPIRHQRNPSDYALVIIGSPVWAGHLSVPMRSYLHDQRGRLRRVAAFWVSGSGGPYPAVERDIAEMSGCKCIATQNFAEREVRAGAIETKLNALTASIQARALTRFDATLNSRTKS
jgi:hypothetical protein